MDDDTLTLLPIDYAHFLLSEFMGWAQDYDNVSNARRQQQTNGMDHSLSEEEKKEAANGNSGHVDVHAREEESRFWILRQL